MTRLQGKIVLAIVGGLSAVLGAVLIAIGIVSRHDRTVAAGKRRFHGRSIDSRS